MRLAQIEYFLEVAEQLNFTAAAKSLYISQPALSKQISLLEEELGVRLFVRNTRQVTLTAAGRQLEMDLKMLREQLADAVERASQLGRREQHTLRIGCFDGAFTDDFLPAMYQHLSVEAPEMRISLLRGDFVENRRLLEKGEIDLLLTLDIGYSLQKEDESRILSKRRGALIYSDKSPLARSGDPKLSDFSRETFLTMSRKLSSGLYQTGIENLERLGIVPASIEEMENFSTLYTRLGMGHGFALLSEEAAADHPHLQCLVLPEIKKTNVIAVWKKRNATVNNLMKNYSSRKGR